MLGRIFIYFSPHLCYNIAKGDDFLLENIIFTLLIIFTIPLLSCTVFFIDYQIEEQKHRHKIELEKAKQGIFDEKQPKQSFFKKYGIHLIIVFVITIIVVLICYAFKVPSDITKYILELVK